MLKTDLLLAVEPENLQARSLRTLIEQSVTRDGYIGMSGVFSFNYPSPVLVSSPVSSPSPRPQQKGRARRRAITPQSSNHIPSRIPMSGYNETIPSCLT